LNNCLVAIFPTEYPI